VADRLRQSGKLADVWGPPTGLGLRPFGVVRVWEERAVALGVSADDVRRTLRLCDGGVTLPAARDARRGEVLVCVEDGRRLDALGMGPRRVRSSKGEMVPLSTVVRQGGADEPEDVERFDGRPMVRVTAVPGPKVTLAEVRALVDGAAEDARAFLKLPGEYRVTWIGETPAGK
jgi:multidrug efflux pump subunit AcrB